MKNIFLNAVEATSERGHVNTQDRSILKRSQGGYGQSSVKKRYTTDM